MGDILYDMFMSIFGNNFFDSVIDILALNPQKEFKTAWKFMVDTHNDVIVPVAVGLLFIYFIISVIQKSSSEQFNFDQLFLMTAKMIGAKFLIEHGLDIMITLFSFGITIMLEMKTVYEGANGADFIAELGPAWESLTGCDWNGGGADVETPGTMASLWCLVKLFIPYALAFILKIVIQVLCYARLMEILLKMILAPIAFADFFHEGMQGSGWRFIKRYFAITLQGFAMAATAVLYATMSASILGSDSYSFDEFVIIYLVITFSCLGVLVKTGQITNELVGV